MTIHPLGDLLPTVELGGLSLSSIDENTGVEYDVTNLDGWDGGTAIRASTEDLPADHGAYDTEPLYGAKNMTIEGTIWAATEQELQQGKQRFMSLTSNLSRKLLIVREPALGLERQMLVRRAGDPVFVRGGYNHYAYTLPILAPDPRRYAYNETVERLRLAQTETSGFGFPLSFPFGFAADAASDGDVSVRNAGDLFTWPIFTIPGPIINPVIRNHTTGEQISLLMTLLADEFVVIDTRNRTVMLAGSASRRNAVTHDSLWPRIVPGENLIQFRGQSTILPELTIRFRSAWK